MLLKLFSKHVSNSQYGRELRKVRGSAKYVLEITKRLNSGLIMLETHMENFFFESPILFNLLYSECVQKLQEIYNSLNFLFYF